MTAKAIAVEPDGQIDDQLQLDGFRDYQDILGGYFECLYLSDGSVMFINDDGHGDHNPVAVAVAVQGGLPHLMQQGIFGTVILVGTADDEGEITDVTDQVCEWLARAVVAVQWRV